jgi:hypothetical protein
MVFYREALGEIGEMVSGLVAAARAELEQGSRPDGAGQAFINRGALLAVCAVSRSSFARERKCGALIRAGYGALPCSRACARGTRSDQGQAVETPRFEVQRTGDYRASKSDQQRSPASAALRANDASI